MKRVKSWLSILILTLMLCPMVVHAGSSSDVWSEITKVDDGIEMDVYSNGQVVNGYFEIQYEGDDVVCSEDDVTFSESVGYHSVNIEDKLISVAVVSEDAIEEGVMFRVKFNSSDVKVTFYGEANATEGQALKATNTAEKLHNLETPEESAGDSEDSNSYGVYVILGVVIVALVIALTMLLLKKRIQK